MTTDTPIFTHTNLIVTIAIYGKDNFTCTQNEYNFTSSAVCASAAKHYASEAFRRNIEAAGAFVKVDCFTY